MEEACMNQQKIIAVLTIFLLSGCASWMKERPIICEGLANIGRQDYRIPIYEIRDYGGKTQYLAGSVFKSTWVDTSNFTSTTCVK